MEERRSHYRYVLWFPVTLATPAGEVGAICRDASRGGMLVSAQAPLPAGSTLTARFRLLPPPAEEIACEGNVVRSERNSDDLELVFPFRLGIEFAPPRPDLEEQLRDAETRARP